MTENTYLLGIDFGTESVRAAIFDLAGHPVSFAATTYRTTHPHPGWAEQDPEEWWEALQASCRKVIAASGVSPAAIKGISYDATTMTVVAMDKRGEALRPAIMWMDVRATEQAARAEKSDSVARLYNGRGTAPATAEWYPFKAAWLRENERETYDAAYRLVDAPDWVTYKLTGEWTTNINSAALRMYYNRDQGGWPTDFYETIGCGDVFSKIPENVVDLGTPAGELSVIAAQLLGLRPGIPVAQGPADAWAGQIGLGVVEPGVMALITGSSHVLTGQTDKPIHGKGFFGAYTDGVVKGQYTVEGGQVSTGSVLKWFKDNFARDLIQAAEATGLNVYDILNKQKGPATRFRRADHQRVFPGQPHPVHGFEGPRRDLGALAAPRPSSLLPRHPGVGLLRHRPQPAGHVCGWLRGQEDRRRRRRDEEPRLDADACGRHRGPNRPDRGR